MEGAGKLICVRYFGTRRAVIVISIFCAESASAKNNKGDTHMAMTETSISTAQTSFGIAGLTRSELQQIQSFIEALRRPNSDIESISEQAGGAERAPDQSECDGGRSQYYERGGWDRPQPVRVLIRPAAKRSAKSNKRPIGTYTRKQKVILRRRAERGEFQVVGNLFVLVPNTRTKANAEPDTPDRQ